MRCIKSSDLVASFEQCIGYVSSDKTKTSRNKDLQNVLDQLLVHHINTLALLIL